MIKLFIKDGRSYTVKFFQKPESLDISLRNFSVYWGRLIDMPAVLDIVPLEDIKDMLSNNFKYCIIQ